MKDMMAPALGQVVIYRIYIKNKKRCTNENYVILYKVGFLYFESGAQIDEENFSGKSCQQIQRHY